MIVRSRLALVEQLRLGASADAQLRRAVAAARKSGADPVTCARTIATARAKAGAAEGVWRPTWLQLHGLHYPGPAAAASTDLLESLAQGPVELLRSADVCFVQTSGGKDSIVAMARAVHYAREAGCLEKLVAVHCDLGSAEWPGVKELARRQAEHFGLRFLVVSDPGGFLGLVERRGMWPSADVRNCTSTLKRDKVGPLITAAVAQLGLDGQAVVLNAMGVRSGESHSRSLKSKLAVDTRASSGRRLVLTWNVVFDLTTEDIWQEIVEQGLEYHPIYDTGLDRLSCIFCVLAPEAALVLASRVCFALELDLPAVYTALERQIGHTFKHGVALGGIVAAARMLDALDGPLTWDRGDAVRRHLGEEAVRRWERNLALAA